MPPNAPPNRPTPLNPDWRAAGAAFAALLGSWRLWVHRRVETIVFQDETVARRHVSVDFTIPAIPPPVWTAAGEPLQYIPLTRLRKRTLTNFDLVDEGTTALPLLAREQHKLLATEALVAAAAKTIDLANSPGVTDACRLVATTGPSEAWGALRTLERHPGLAESALFLDLARGLAESFVITVPLLAEPGRRRILKFSYDELVGDPPLPAREHVTRGASLRSKAIWFPVYALSDVPSYHLEVEAPTGLQIRRRELLTNDGQPRDQRRGPYRRARFYRRPQAATRGVASIHLRPRTSTIIRAAAGLSVMTVALLVSLAVALFYGAFRQGPGAATSALLIVPGFLSVLLIRPGEHALTTDMLYFVRFLTLVPGVLTFVAAVLLVTVPPTSTVLLSAWAALVLIACVPAALLCGAWWYCRAPSDPDRPETRAAHTF